MFTIKQFSIFDFFTFPKNLIFPGAFAYSREYSESDVFPRLFAHPCLSSFDICIKKKTWNIFILICTYGCTVHLQKPNMKLCINRKVKSKQLLYPLMSIPAVRVIKKRRIVRTKYAKVALAGDIPASFSGPSPCPLTFYEARMSKKREMNQIATARKLWWAPPLPLLVDVGSLLHELVSVFHPDWLIRSNFRLRVSGNLSTNSQQNSLMSTCKKLTN